MITIDISEAQKALEGTAKSIDSIQRQSLAVVSKGTVKAIKSAIQTSDLQRRTGELLKAYRYKIRRDNESAIIFPKKINSDSTIFPKAMTLSYGHSGATKRAKNWTIKPRGFVQKGAEYVENGSWDIELQAMIEKELNKYWG